MSNYLYVQSKFRSSLNTFFSVSSSVTGNLAVFALMHVEFASKYWVGLYWSISGVCIIAQIDTLDIEGSLRWDISKVAGNGNSSKM